MDHKNAVEECIRNRGDLLTTSRKIYLSYRTEALVDHPDIEFEIRDKIKNYMNIGIHCVQIAGSAKTGYSFHEKRPFIEGESDLDIAIISSERFIYYCQYISMVTRNYADVSKFGRTREGVGYDELMKDNIAEFGMVNFILMPSSPEKTRMNGFLNELSKSYTRFFKEITIAVYASSYFFEAKQKASLSNVYGGGSV